MDSYGTRTLGYNPPCILAPVRIKYITINQAKMDNTQELLRTESLNYRILSISVAEWLKRNTYNIVGVALALSFFPILSYVLNCLDNRHDKQLLTDGVKTIANVVEMYKVKRGYDVVYSYHTKDGSLVEMVERFSSAEEIDKQKIEVGNCYNLVYYRLDPEIRKIDFSQRVGCQETNLNKRELEQLKERCSCSAAKILDVENKGEGVLVRYMAHIGNRYGYARSIKISRKADIDALRIDSIFLVLYDVKNHSIQRIFLNTPRLGLLGDTFPTDLQCKQAINDLQKHPEEVPYIY